ncbi:pilus assembly protein [Niveibacterium terrae]|uniref:pilus assembly protein n=1 Tax=Niveibacterium terrae TaxID=3373598 RepID=UPI003A8F8859
MRLLSLLIRFVRVELVFLAAALGMTSAPPAFAAATDLSDQPMFVTNNVPPNMMLTLSVEWPTGVVAAYSDNVSTVTGLECPGRPSTGVGACYFESRRYIGYFDPERCYVYKSDTSTDPNKPIAPGGARSSTAVLTEYFKPSAVGSGTSRHRCSSAFSGNFLNWATMHALDEFRFALTGGDRVIDTSTQTVVEKTRHVGTGGHDQFPVKWISNSSISAGGSSIPAVGVSSVTPFTWSNLYVRVTNGGTELNPWSDTNTRGRVMQISNSSSFPATSGTNYTYTYLVRVEVCNASAPGGLEYSADGDYMPCTDYGLVRTGSGDVEDYKPTGLIQKNASRMRYGVSAYQFDTTQTHPKGVLRARLKSVGPTLAVPSGAAPSNSNAEWDAYGVYVANPDSADAAASAHGVVQSGVINYLNKFGKANGYVSYDTLSELYYAGLRALRNLGPAAGYVSGLTTAMYDGFPIITTPVDESNEESSRPLRPVQYSCQRSNFVGIADTNTHTDVDIPGNTLAGYSGHPMGGAITDDPDNLNAKKLTDLVGKREGYSATFLGSYSPGRSASFHVAGLAYWANTNDILIDNPDKPWTLGKQTAQTFWMDVRESGGQGKVNNQMWLAAKYGGFDDINANGIPASDSTWHTNSDAFTDAVTSTMGVTNGGKRPDNYFTGDRPDTMISSLKSIFTAVLSKSLSSAGASLSSINFQSTSAGAYTVKYNSKDWSGDVLGNTITVDSSGTPLVSNVWSAQAKLDGQATDSAFWNTGRLIATTNPALTTAIKGVPFRLDSLSSVQKNYLGATATDQLKMLNYLRGDKSNEGTLYRIRPHLLGDIVSSEATVVAGPDATYKDAYNPGYSTFTRIARAPRVYVGANDGMLHAFSGDVSATQVDGGMEKWAYIPSFVLRGPSTTATPSVDGLAARSALGGFIHKYYVDQTPYVRDVDFSRTLGATPSAGGDWHSILVGGLGKGGRGYFAIDVTQPSAITSEATLAGKVLWEFSDEDMGFSFGRPVIAKTKRDGWVVILSSGYNNVDGSDATHRGKGFLYVLNAKTGALIEKISTGAGSADSPSGFAHPAAFIQDSADFTLDYVYGGDLLGNVWRFDLTASSGSYPSPLKFATLADSSGTAQPVTVEPRIEIGDNAKDRWVFIGTGKLLASSDLVTANQQSFYAFRDGSRTRAYGPSPAASNQSSLPTNGSFPITRSQMVKNTNLLLGYAKDLNYPMGWYYELISSSEKITSSIVANEGVVSWTAYLPSTDVCSPGAASKTYAAEYDTGKSRITIDNVTVEYLSSSSYLVKVQFVKDASGKIRAILTTGDPTAAGGQIQALSGSFGRNYGKGVRVNWREILN